RRAWLRTAARVRGRASLEEAVSRSYLELRHCGHDHETDHLACHPGPEQREAARIGEQLHQVLRVYEIEDPGQDQRERSDDERARPGFRRHGPGLVLHLLASPQDVGQVLERLGEIAAGFPLNHHADDEEIELGNIEPTARLPQRLIERPSQLYVVDDVLELRRNRWLEVATDTRYSLADRQTGTHPANDLVDGLGKLAEKAAGAALDEKAD